MDTNNDHRSFRVWDIKEKCYVDKEHDHRYSYICEDGSVEVYRHARGETYFDDDSHDGRYVSEQCTGLKDQDGKLVYQNDRIHIEDPIPGVQEDVDLVVTWDKGGWVGQGKHGKCSLWAALTHRKVRVVGTIHDTEV